MSVINKMLRDLDHRQAPESRPSTAPIGQGLRRDTVSIASTPVLASGAHALRWLGAGVLGVALLAAAGWVWQQEQREKPRSATLALHVPAQQAAPPIAEAVQAQPAAPAPQSEPPVEVAQVPVNNAVQVAPRSVSASMVLRMDSTLSRKEVREIERSAASAVAKVEASAERPQAPTPPVAAAASARAVPADAAQLAQRQQQASKDAMAHAQSLWNAGSRDAAIEWMEEVVATAERAVAAGATPATTQLLAVPVRELARMQLAQSHPQAVWDLLTRLEPFLGNQADLWAVRANAAQRLGRHQDSVHAYMAALQSRPNEQRWLLGAAVSLAALGQASSAADMAEKARAVGTVSKDVLVYLRQMGVAVKD